MCTKYSEDKPYSKYKIGEVIDGSIIEKIYSYDDDREYIVFLEKSTYMVKYSSSQEENDNKIYKIISNINKINDLLIDIGDTNLTKKHSNFIATSMMKCLNKNDNCDDINKQLEIKSQNIINQRQVKGQLEYAVVCVKFVITNIIVSIILNILEIELIKYVHKEIITLFYVATFGSIGGFISVARELKNLNLNFEGIPKIYKINACLRIFIAMSAGVISYLLVKSKTIVGFLDEETINYTIFLFAVIAGWSEHFVPDMLEKVEWNLNNKNNEEENNK